MAHVTLPDGREFDIDDGQSALESYYLGEGATVSKSLDATGGFPRVFNGGDSYEDEQAPAEQVAELPDGQVAEQHSGDLPVEGGDPLNLSGTEQQ